MVITSSLSNPLVYLETWYLESSGGVPWQWLNEVIPKGENPSFIDHLEPLKMIMHIV